MASLNFYTKTDGLKKLTIEGKTNDVLSGATETTNGKIGLAPAPMAGQQEYLLYGDGTWKKLDIASEDTVKALFS